jgi:transcriptional regulator with XRE-family HTH domain
MDFIICFEAIGKRLKKIRREESITQAKLAELTNMSDCHISRIETGAKNMGLQAAASISKALDITLDYLVFGKAPS